MKGRNTKIVSFRVTDDFYDKLLKSAAKKEMSVGEYIKWLLEQFVR